MGMQTSISKYQSVKKNRNLKYKNVAMKIMETGSLQCSNSERKKTGGGGGGGAFFELVFVCFWVFFQLRRELALWSGHVKHRLYDTGCFRPRKGTCNSL